MRKFVIAGLSAIALALASPAVSADAHELTCTQARQYASGFYGDNDASYEASHGGEHGTGVYWWTTCSHPYYVPYSLTWSEHRMNVGIAWHPIGDPNRTVYSSVWAMFRDGTVVDTPNISGYPVGFW
jgi:hypothetical protein